MPRPFLLLPILFGLAAPALAADCTTVVNSSDAMKYDTAKIEVPASCKSFTVQLKHTGKLPKAAMGHNWVLAHATDMQAVASAGLAAGAAAGYLKADDARILAHTKLIGGGESDSVSFPVSRLKAGEKYRFFCTFPGHLALMQGELTLAAK